MKKDDDILTRIDRRDGMTVPEGFFDDFCAKMTASLPENPEAEHPAVRLLTPWQRMRPFVYMAAMFAGIWCMLKMFSLMSPAAGVDLSIENNRVLTDALSDENFFYEHVIDDVSEREMLDDLWDDSVSVEDIMAPEGWDEQQEQAGQSDWPAAEATSAESASM